MAVHRDAETTTRPHRRSQARRARPLDPDDVRPAIETAGGSGDLAGQVWRIGCMGHAARPGKVDRVLEAPEAALTAASADR